LPPQHYVPFAQPYIEKAEARGAEYRKELTKYNEEHGMPGEWAAGAG